MAHKRITATISKGYHADLRRLSSYASRYPGYGHKNISVLTAVVTPSTLWQL